MKQFQVPVPSHELDEKDLHILALLQEDGRITNVEIARHINLSGPATLQRVRRLEQLGLISGYHAELDREKLGYRLLVIALISLSLHQESGIDQFKKSILEIPNVIELLHISGEYDFMLKIIVPDMSAYRELINEHLSQVRGVGRIHSCFVMGIEKESRSLPLDRP